MSEIDINVTVGGRDVTMNMRPYLISADVVDRDGVESDELRLAFDDKDGQLLLPSTGDPVGASIDGIEVFGGYIDSTPWRFTRGGGRVLEVVARAFDTRSKVKERQRWHLDDATLEDALSKSAKRAGLSGVVVSPSLRGIFRDYWNPDGASFLAWAQSLAREFGATFKIRGDRAVFALRGEGLSAVGSAMPTVVGKIGAGGNVISLDIDPAKGRFRFQEKRVRYFDRESSSFMERVVSVDESDGVRAIGFEGWPAANDDQARTMAEGGRIEADRAGGIGTVELALDPTAQVEGTFQLVGARPGIDGSYRITSVTHRVVRDLGSATILELSQPQGAAGKDARAE